MNNVKDFENFLLETEEMGIWVKDIESSEMLSQLPYVDTKHPVLCIRDNYTHLLAYKLKNSNKFELVILSSEDGIIKTSKLTPLNVRRKFDTKEQIEQEILYTTGYYEKEWFYLD